MATMVRPLRSLQTDRALLLRALVFAMATTTTASQVGGGGTKVQKKKKEKKKTKWRERKELRHLRERRTDERT